MRRLPSPAEDTQEIILRISHTAEEVRNTVMEKTYPSGYFGDQEYVRR